MRLQPFSSDKENYLSALRTVAVLLDRLGGSVTFGPSDFNQMQEIIEQYEVVSTEAGDGRQTLCLLRKAAI